MGSIPPLPLAFLIFSALSFTFVALVLGTELTENTTGTDPCSLLCVDQIFGFLGDLVTFNILGAPVWVRLPMSLILGFPWVYTLAGVVIGIIP